ncbi:MAG: Nif3-like dinuclear metal center hexameric protein [Sphingobacteriales bacterium]|nr:MAG: Nif3-like dinuclear metal center hexameric protein [Sphingobacteriales bacterium]
MQLQHIIWHLEHLAPPAYQESYDNSGLQVGLPEAEISGVLVALDVTEQVLDEAEARGANLIVMHHPLLFKGLKRISNATAIERIVWKAIQKNIALYAIHTNLDNMMQGVNAILARKLGLQPPQILVPQADVLSKLQVYVPEPAAAAVLEALFNAGAGQIGSYAECSYRQSGTGTFRPLPEAHPAIGTAGGPRENLPELNLQVLVPRHLEQAVIAAMKAAHPYEEVAYDLIRLANTHPYQGAGMIGMLPEPEAIPQFLERVKKALDTGCIRYTRPGHTTIQKVAICGGAGASFLKAALRAGADAYLTGDFKYHEFFDGEDRILIADVGHWESEQHTTELLVDYLRQKLPNFAVHPAGSITNPVHYFH